MEWGGRNGVTSHQICLRVQTQRERAVFMFVRLWNMYPGGRQKDGDKSEGS